MSKVNDNVEWRGAMEGEEMKETIGANFSAVGIYVV